MLGGCDSRVTACVDAEVAAAAAGCGPVSIADRALPLMDAK